MNELLLPREGVIIDTGWMLSCNDARDVIMTFWTDVFEVDNVDDDDEWPLGVYIYNIISC